ncbi:MAG: hypothetical protein IPG80_12640 [Anaerolineales bacterium]|uniref:hypothetical protein n=1 Tax=Candidatus Villigracilis vicinus TaxID=3140679 RepID=UPI00313767A0|nr:hypothetical protein [Anaerolineales bacterium]MBK7449180.1 hypothetical protein [Anaerolineales bacterium]MBK9781171.1 hypothetical protein [Anaerolineales bacterium]
MSTFQSPQIIRIPEKAQERASTFAEHVITTVNYKDSNQSVKEKIRDDHFISKLGEEAVRILFEGRNCRVDGPDYGVYEARRKSWAADLRVNDLEVAVKTQRRSAAKRYGLSWTFQDSPERRDPILDMPDAWVCLVVFEDLKEEKECLVYPLRKIRQLIFEAPRLSRLVGKKQAVYLETLIHNGILDK